MRDFAIFCLGTVMGWCCWRSYYLGVLSKFDEFRELINEQQNDMYFRGYVLKYNRQTNKLYWENDGTQDSEQGGEGE